MCKDDTHQDEHTTPGTACVCVSTRKESRGGSPARTKTHEGAAMPPLGRGRCPRLAGATTTTTGTIKLDSSSIGRLWYHVVTEVEA